jgi:hypothetical protein
MRVYAHRKNVKNWERSRVQRSPSERSFTDIFRRLSSLNFILYLNTSQSFTVLLILSKMLCELMLIEKM